LLLQFCSDFVTKLATSRDCLSATLYLGSYSISSELRKSAWVDVTPLDAFAGYLHSAASGGGMLGNMSVAAVSKRSVCAVQPLNHWFEGCAPRPRKRQPSAFAAHFSDVVVPNAGRK